MTLLYLYAMASWLALTVNVLVQVGVCRWMPRSSLMRSIFIGFLAGLALLGAVAAAYVALGPLAAGDALASAALNLLTYGVLSFGYFHFINLGETARRIRIIREIDAAGRPLTREEILDRYSAESIVQVRLQRLLSTGQIAQREGRYYLANPTVLRMAQMIVLMKRLVLGKRSEFA